MTRSPTPRGADRASNINETMMNILNYLPEHQGRSANSISKTLGIPYKLASNILDGLVKEGTLTREGKGTQHRYYTSDYDRTKYNEHDFEPTTRGKVKKPAFSPSPDSLIGQSLQSPSQSDPRGPSIPSDLKAYTEMEPADRGIVTEEEKTRGIRALRTRREETKEEKEEKKGTEEERTGDIDPGQMPVGWETVETPAPSEVADVVGPVPMQAPTPVPVEVENIDTVLDQLKMLKAIPTGSHLDATIRAAIADAEDSLSSCLAPCPFCGGHAAINTKGEIQSVLCTCGATFAYAKNNKDLALTVKAWNRRSMI